MRATKPLTVLETVHGSHLYGLATPTSDLDTYRVVARRAEDYSALEVRGSEHFKTVQTIKDGDDVLVTNLSAFLRKCDEGVPQALEALFSPVATSLLEDFRQSYFINTAAVANTYRRTIMNFARLGVEDGEASALLAPTSDRDGKKKRVRESLRAKKPARVQTHGMLKYRRHSLRLLLNLEEAMATGRFNPRLTEAQRAFVLEGTDRPPVEFARLVTSRVG